jgi:hypothetical protein
MGSALKEETVADEAAEEAFAGSLLDVAPDDLLLPTVLHALSDPIRLRIVASLADDNEWTCGSFELPIAKSTPSLRFEPGRY